MNMETQLSINKQWTLFLDRDGVINKEISGDYVRNWEMFSFLENSLEAFPVFSGLFGRIIIVTNQRGIGKGIMKEQDLEDIHSRMNSAIIDIGGRIDHVFFCPALSNEDPCRKPNPGMAFQAKTLYPEIDLTRSVMIGNSLSDIQFGKRLGMFTCLMASDKAYPAEDMHLVDHTGNNLYEIAKFLEAHQNV